MILGKFFLFWKPVPSFLHTINQTALKLKIQDIHKGSWRSEALLFPSWLYLFILQSFLQLQSRARIIKQSMMTFALNLGYCYITNTNTHANTCLFSVISIFPEILTLLYYASLLVSISKSVLHVDYNFLSHKSGHIQR